MKFAVDTAGLPDKYGGFAQMCGTMHDDGFAQVVPSLESADPAEHLPGLFVRLYLMNADGSENRTLLEFFGGQGSINVTPGPKPAGIWPLSVINCFKKNGLASVFIYSVFSKKSM